MCLNPCCNGILPDTSCSGDDLFELSVLILVVMEYSLTYEKIEKGDEVTGLNPCCNGILPD